MTQQLTRTLDDSLQELHRSAVPSAAVHSTHMGFSVAAASAPGGGTGRGSRVGWNGGGVGAVSVVPRTADC